MYDDDQDPPKPRRSFDDIAAETEAEFTRPSKKTRPSFDSIATGISAPDRQPYGPPLDTADPKQASRYKEAASQAAFIESSRRRATSLFQQADQTPENEVASRKNKNGSDVPVFSGPGFSPMPKRQFLRDAADAELAKANFAAEEAKRNYGDLLEVGYGADADPKSKRQWAYAKPKHTSVMIEQARLERESGQAAPSSPPLRARAQTARPNAAQDVINRIGATATSGLASIPESFGRLLDTLTPTGAETVASQPGYARLTPEQRALIANHQGSEAEKAQIAANMIESNKALVAMDINDRNKKFSIGEKFRPLTRAGQKEAEAVFPTDPTVEGSSNPLKPGFYRRTLPEAVGSTIPFMVSHKVGTGLGLSGRTVAGAGGVGLEVANEYEKAEQAGATPEQLKKIVQAATVAGATEAFGAESLLGKIGLKGKSVPGHLAKEILGEAAQEASQSLIEDLGAKYYARTQPDLTAGQIAQNALENAVPAAFLGAGGGVAGIPGHRAEQRASQQEAARVAAEPGAPMNLVPTVPDGTQTDIRRIAPKPVDLASQKAQQAAQQSTPATQPGQPVQPMQPVAPAGTDPSLLFPQAQSPTTAEDLSGLQGPERVAKMLENVRRMREGKANATIEQQLNKDFGDASGLLDAAETNWDTDRPSAELYADQGVKKLKGSLQNLQNSPGYQAELGAAAQGQQLPATPYTSAVQAINQRLARANALINRDAEIERQQKEEQAAAEASQKEADKLQRKTEKEQAKAARIQTREELQRQREIAVEERKAQLAAERSAAAEVRRQKQEAAKTSRRAELEKMRANAQNEKQAKLAEAELQRMASHDAALKAADDAGQRSQKFHAEGRTAEAVNELVVQQNQIRDAIKFLPRTPEAQNTKADLNRYYGQVGNRIGDLRRESRGVRGPVTEAIPPLMRPDAAVNPDGGVPSVQSFYTPGAGFERLAAGQKEASDEQRPLLTAIRQMGGISDDGDTSGELRRLGVKESGTTGIVNNRTGLSPDEMRAQLAEDGYLPPDSTVDDLFQAIEGELRAGARKEESISDFYDRFAEEDGEAERQGDEEARPSFDDIAAEVEAEHEQPSEEELDQAAYRRALDRSVQNRGERVAPGEPGKGKSLSGFNTMLSRNGEKIDRLREMNLTSPEAKQIIEEIRADNEKMAIEYNRRHLTPHLDELLTMIMSDQFAALAEEDGDLREQIVEEARALPVVERTEVEREVAAVDVVFDDEDMRNLLARAVEGDDNATSDFIELATDYYGLNEETTTDLIRNRRADRARQQAEVRRAAQPRTQNRVSAPNAEESQSTKSQQLTDRERQLLNLKPDDIFDDRFDDYMAKIEDIHARAVRGELDIDPQTIHDSTRWVGLSPEEVEVRRAAGERAPILNRIHGNRSARVEENRLPARENLETINKYMHADLLSLAAPSKSNRMSRLDEVINAARITVEKKPTGMSAAKLAEVNDLLQRALSARAEFLATKSEEIRTVSHSNPAIDGKEIIRETDDGKVIVANPDNKTGISVVKDRTGSVAAKDFEPLAGPKDPAIIKNRKREIGKLMPFNIQGNKSDLLAKGLGSLMERAAKGTNRMIDAFAGSGTYTHYMRDRRIANEGDILNEFEPLRHIAHKQLRDNPEAVAREADRVVADLRKITVSIREGEPFTEKTDQVRQQVASYFQGRLRALVNKGENLNERGRTGEPVEMADSPETAGVYLVLQNQSFNFLPVQAEVSAPSVHENQSALGFFEADAAAREPKFRLPGFGVISNEGGKVGLFAHGRERILQSGARAIEAGRRMQGVDVRRGDGWALIGREAKAGDLVPVDTSYLNRGSQETSNYNKATAEDAVPSVYNEKVRKYLLPAWDRGAKLVITNNWNEGVASYLHSLGFRLLKASRQGATKDDVQSGGAAELIAINFDPATGDFFRRPGNDVSSQFAEGAGRATFERRGTIAGQGRSEELAAKPQGQNEAPRGRANAGEPVTYQVYRGIGEKPNDHGVAGKGEYWSGREQVAKAYAGRSGEVRKGEITLRRPLSLEYGELNALQKRLYGKPLSGFDANLSAQFDQYLRDQGYDGVVLFDLEISKTIPEEVVRLAPLTEQPAISPAPAQRGGEKRGETAGAISSGDVVTWANSKGQQSGKVDVIRSGYATVEKADGTRETVAVKRLSKEHDSAASLRDPKPSPSTDTNYWQTPAMERLPQSHEEAQSLIANARAEFRPRTRNEAGTVWTNQQGAYVIGTAMQQLGIEIVPHSLGGVNLRIERASEIADLIREGADHYDDSKTLTGIADQIDTAVADARANSSSHVVIADSTLTGASGKRSLADVKQTVREERFHGWQREAGLLTDERGKAIDRRFAGDPVYGKIRARLIQDGYDRADIAGLAIEAPAKLASGQAEQFGITPQDAYEFLFQYANFITRRYGTDVTKALSNFTPGAKAGFEDVADIAGQRSAGTDRGNTFQRSGAAAEGQGAGKPRGSAASLRESKNAAGEDGGDQGRRREEVAPGSIRGFLADEGGSASLGLGIPQIASRLFNQPKTTPLRAILEDHGPLIVDPFKIQDQTLDAIYKAGTEGTLPGARALYWADKLKAKKLSDKVANFQANFIESTLDKTNKLIEASEAMAQATRGSREYEAAKKKIERLNLQIANAISRMGEYTHPAAYAAKAYKTNLLSAPHIHLFNVLEQIFKFPLHEAQRAIDFMVPTKTFQKWGIPYEKGITDFRDLVPAIETELRGLATGLARSPRDIADMLYYGVTRQMQRMDAAENDHAGGTDKFELGHRAKMIPGLDQVINFIGRMHGAADIAFGNMVNASLIGAQANAQARKIGKKMGFKEKEIRDLARDLANEPSAAIVTLASDATERFKLDYPTLAYDALQALRNLPVEKVGGRHLGEAYKAALDFVVPFSKIPLAAVDTYLFRYSPVGLARTAGRLVTANSRKGTDKPATGRYTGEMAAQRHAEDTAELFRQGAIGTISWALMGALASFGYIKFQGGREDDDDRRNVSNVKEILGQDYKQEMVAGDRAYNLHRMGPLGEATAIGSRMYQAGQPRRNPLTGEPEDAFKRAGRVAKAGKDAIIFNNPLGNAAKDIAGDDSHSSMIGNFIGNKTRGLVPGALRDVAKVKNPTKVVPDDSSLGARLKAGVQSGMPFDAGFGKRADMAPRLDAMGNPVEEPNPFQFSRPVKHDPQIEEMLKLGVGVGKPKRDGGTPAAEYNDQIRARAAETRTALDRIAADTEQAGRSDVAKARIYSRELSPAAMERAAKLSDGTIDTERSIEALRADAYEALRADQAYQRLNDRQKLEARKRIDDQLKSYRGRAASSRGREKAASVPGYSPQELARMAVGPSILRGMSPSSR